ncbi:MAG: ATP-binding cassette domain-containing protein [Oligoflexia bacterium]|nr:ATP-binding cassette domain-containing protein [Oligoflexia bacterium]
MSHVSVLAQQERLGSVPDPGAIIGMCYRFDRRLMVNLTRVSKSYFGQVRVLDEISLELKKGDFLYVVGGSGAGKSSLLRLLATEEAATSGSLSLFGYDLNTISPTTLRSIRRLLGYVPQDVRLIPDLSVADNVALSLSLAGRRVLSTTSRSHIDELLERLGLAAKRHKPASALSGGEAQRVAVARALIRQPELIVADEPTGAQDRDFTWSLMDLFLKANLNGATVVVATHDREIVRRVRKRCAVLKAGRLAIEEALCYY